MAEANPGQVRLRLRRSAVRQHRGGLLQAIVLLFSPQICCCHTEPSVM